MNIDQPQYQGISLPAYPQIGECVVSAQMVMQSANGYYIGRECLDYNDYGGPEPEWMPMSYSRDSEYFATAEEAQSYLEHTL